MGYSESIKIYDEMHSTRKSENMHTTVSEIDNLIYLIYLIVQGCKQSD